MPGKASIEVMMKLTAKTETESANQLCFMVLELILPAIRT